MRMSRMIGMALLAGVATMGGCNNKVKEQNALLMEENESLRAQLADRNSVLETVNQELRNKQLELTRLERERRETPAVAANTGNPFAGIEGVTGSFGAGEVRAAIESDVLFDSGKITLKANAKTSLDQVANVLNSQYSAWTIRIEGHTDTDPIRKSGHKSNMHLGFERANVVREYLISRGVADNKIIVASYGPHQPRGSKPQSRRVEIVAVQR